LDLAISAQELAACVSRQPRDLTRKEAEQRGAVPVSACHLDWMVETVMVKIFVEVDIASMHWNHLYQTRRAAA